MTILASPASVVPKTYAELRRRVEAVFVTGRRQVEEAWVNTHHETGQLIHYLGFLIIGEYEYKVRRKLEEIPFDLLVELPGGHPVKLGEIAIEQYPLPPALTRRSDARWS